MPLLLLLLSLNLFASPERKLNSIAFGSSNYQFAAQPLWKVLIEENPDLWIWNGDMVYADWKNLDSIKQAYEKQNENEDYRRFKINTPIIGVWDDHDYGWDNLDGEFEFKKESQKLALDFLDEPEDSPRRNQEGIYTSYEFGSAPQKIKIILLDVRYFKNLDPEYPILGKNQWEWLRKELSNSNAAIHFIVSPISVFSPLIPYSEEWTDTSEANRMSELLQELKVPGPVLLTGDKHFGSIFQRWGQLEFISSGMTHVAPRSTWNFLSKKYPTAFFGLNFGLVNINWDKIGPIIKLNLKSTHGEEIFPSTFHWSKTGWIRHN